MSSLFEDVTDPFEVYEELFYQLLTAPLGDFEPRLQAIRLEVRAFFEEIRRFDPHGTCLRGLYQLALSEQKRLGLHSGDLRSLFVRYIRPYPDAFLAWNQMVNLWDRACRCLGVGVFMLALKRYEQEQQTGRLFFHRLIPLTLATMGKSYEQLMQTDRGEARAEFFPAYRLQEEHLHTVTFTLLERYGDLETARREQPKSFGRFGLAEQFDTYRMEQHVTKVVEELRQVSRERILPYIVLPPERFENAASRIEGISAQEEQILKMELPLTCSEDTLKKIAYLRRIRNKLCTS